MSLMGECSLTMSVRLKKEWLGRVLAVYLIRVWLRGSEVRLIRVRQTLLDKVVKWVHSWSM